MIWISTYNEATQEEDDGDDDHTTPMLRYSPPSMTTVHVTHAPIAGGSSAKGLRQHPHCPRLGLQ